MQAATYKNESYSFYPVKTFLFWEEIDSGMIHSKEQYDYLRLYDIEEVVSNSSAKGINTLNGK